MKKLICLISVIGSLFLAEKSQAMPTYELDLIWWNSSFFDVTINGQLVDSGHNHPVNNGDVIGAYISGPCPTTYNILGEVNEFNVLNQIIGQSQLVLPAGYSYGEWYVSFNDVNGTFSVTFLPGGSTKCN